MYSFEDRMRAVRLYIQYDCGAAATVRELGYPSVKMLRSWHREYVVSGDLPRGYSGNSIYSDEQKQKAIDYFLKHGHRLSKTAAALGYPSRETLRMWIDELCPGVRKIGIRRGRAASISDEQKRCAVIELCSREGSATSVAEDFGVSRPRLYAWKRELLGEEGVATMNKKDDHQLSDDRDELVRELDSLRKRIHQLQLEHDILKKADELLKKDRGIDPHNLTNREKTQLIDALRMTYSLSELLPKLHMAKSSYFYHRARLLRPDKYADVRTQVKRIFCENRSCYGYRRIGVILRRAGKLISEKIIRRIMADEELTASSRRRRRYQSYQGEISPAVDNVIDRDFRAEAPNVKWLTDITEFQIPTGKVYLSPIIDCFDGMVVSWTIGTSPDAELVNAMIDDAIGSLAKGQKPIVHSDRGAHYRWPGWISRMESANLTRSMSKKGCTPDNAACEGFFGRLKNEMYYNRIWRDVNTEEFIDHLDEYIHWYNEKRVKLSLGGQSPIEYRATLGLAA